MVVLLNHRLAVLGYLNLAEIGGAKDASAANVGNLYLVAALEWVCDNPARTGGEDEEAWIAFARRGGPNHPAFRTDKGTADNGAMMIFDNKCEVKNNTDGPERGTVTMA